MPNDAVVRPFRVDVQLYSITPHSTSSIAAVTRSVDSLSLEDSIHSLETLFTMIDEKTVASSHFLIFHIPIDMTQQESDGKLHIARDHMDGETTFQRVSAMLRGARRFPERSCRAIEVEVGL